MQTLPLALLSLLLLVAFGVVDVAVLAKSTDVRRAGTCSGGSTSKIKLSPEDAGLEIEVEVDMNVANRRWLVTVTKAGKQVYRKFHRTNAASGSFSARTVAAGALGGKVVARAVSSSTGEVCTASATFA
jgi:hypothetical protein